uniref:Uncharacterized protein n=1 Tax=Cyclopterus lumpus TaxID=8103 RepID=A0A8C3G8U0_CYCLU
MPRERRTSSCASSLASLRNGACWSPLIRCLSKPRRRSWRTFCPTADQNCRLKTVRLPGCGMTSHACKFLAKALRRSLKLQELDLSMNEIGDDGMKHLADGLRSPECKIATLRLSQCNIEQKGCYHLASALQMNSSSLKVLDLSINTVGDKGANELFKKCDISQLTKLEQMILKHDKHVSCFQHIPPTAVSTLALKQRLRERLLYWTHFNAYCPEHVARCRQEDGSN